MAIGAFAAKAAGPVDSVPLLRPLDDVAGEFLAQQVEIDGSFWVTVGVEALGHDVGEQLGDLVDVGLREVGRCHA